MSKFLLPTVCFLLLVVPAAYAGKEEDAANYSKVLQGNDPVAAKVEAANGIAKLAAIRRSYGKEAVPYLFEACKHKEAKLRAAAAAALGRAYADDDKNAVEVLEELVKSDTDDSVKLAAITGLVAQGMRAKGAIPTLRKIAQENDKSRVGRAAREAVRTLSAR